MAKRPVGFDGWLAGTVETFSGLSLNQQKSTVCRLVNEFDQRRCDRNDVGGHGYEMLQSVLKALRVDMLSRLPTEVAEIICSYVDGRSLLRACSVSRNWNRIISSLQEVWRAKCTLNGFKEIVADNWKVKYVEGQRILENLKADGCLTLSTLPVNPKKNKVINCMIISSGYLYACVGEYLFVWELTVPLNGKPVSSFKYDVQVYTLRVPDPGLVVTGLASGDICARRRGETKRVAGHASPVTGLAADGRLGLVASAGMLEGVVKLWCLRGLCLLAKVPTSREETFTEIVIIPRCGSEKFTLLMSNHLSIIMEHWIVSPGESQRQCEHCKEKEVVRLSTEACAKTYGLENIGESHSTPYHLACREWIYEGGSKVVTYEKNENDEDEFEDEKRKEQEWLDKHYRVVAAGKMFALLFSQNRLTHYSFVLLNVKKRCKVASWKFERPIEDTDREILAVAHGDRSWMDDLGLLVEGQPILAFADTRDRISVVSWKPAVPAVPPRRN
ncbi:F-box/WD repeat-containing protein 2-like [Bacillus rossius redtenbacheri]|uniref:F-box/WD repeat-containing protein 2-like n=1 Tax=Bacillus rossius redtenbacheri TaxID=93214 RepID=UPI002FDE0A49